MLSAQVVLFHSSLPRAQWVMEKLAEAGFTCGPFVGVGFSIEAPIERFEQYFGISAQERGPRPFSSNQIPLGHLAPELRADVQMVIFTSPPAFGPGGSY